jgi:glycine/D-amino acid oxidase-like deaminating enzyme
LRIVVVGAGIVGLCVAWHLAKRGARVSVLDREGPGEGCSYGNSASLSSSSVAPLAMPGIARKAPGMLLDPNGPLYIPARYWLRAAPWLARFVAASRPAEVERISQALAALLGPSIERHREILEEIEAAELLRRDGQLVVYRDRQQLEKDAAVWALRRRHGHRMRIVERPEMLELEPAIGPAYTVGVFLPDEAMVANPYRYCQVLAAALAERGTAIVRESVAAIEVADGAVSGVRGASAVHRADAVIVCAGAWSMQLLGPLGYRIPLETQRGYHITLRDTGIDLRRPVVPADRKVFITSQEAGLRVGGTVELAGLEAPPNARRAELLLQDLRAVFPQARTEGPRSNWMGHRPCLPDSLPVIGESGRHRGLWLAFGHGHLGLTGAAVTGEALARGLFGETPRLDLRPFSVARFSGK